MSDKILIIDDNKDIVELLEYKLNNAGYHAIGFLNATNVIQFLSEEEVDLMLLDRTLPDTEGVRFLEILRSKNINIPVIFLSAKNSTHDIIEGLKVGADDYVSKPFDIDELLLRIQAVLNRYKHNIKETNDIMNYRDIELDLNVNIAYIDSIEVNLSKLEINLLSTLISNKGKILDRDFLIKHVWRDTSGINKRTVNVAIKRLKEKIDPDSSKEYITAVRGYGYLLK